MPLSRLNNKLKQAKHHYHQFGFAKTIVKVLKIIFSFIYKQNVIFILQKSDLGEKVNFALNHNLEIQRIEKKHLKTVEEFIAKHGGDTGVAPFVKINDYFENNYKGFIAFLKDEMIGYSWWVDKTITEKNHPDLKLLGLDLKDDEVYGFDFVIVPRYRGKGNAIEFLYKVHLALSELGYNRTFGIALPDNIPARWLYKLFGLKDVKSIISRRVFYFILCINKLIFLKTNRQCLYYPFGYRALHPFKNVMFLKKNQYFMRRFFYLNNKFQQAKRFFLQFGFGKTCIKVIKAVASLVYKQDVFIIITEKNLGEENEFSFDFKLDLQRIEKKHLSVLEEFIQKCDKDSGVAPIVKIKDYFESGYHGFIAFLKGEIIGYFWWVDNKIETARNHPDLKTYNIKLKNGDAYGFDFVIIPKFRGNSNAMEFFSGVCSALNKLGFNRLLGTVLPDNTPARWIYKLFGFREAKKIISRRLLYSVLLLNKTICFKTSKECLYYPFGYRALYPFKNVMFLKK